MKKSVKLIKKIIFVALLFSLLLYSFPSQAHIEEAINPEARYVIPPVEGEVSNEENTGGAPGKYRVKEGETLSEIANNLGISVERLANINRLKNRNSIYAGQVLRLPGEVVTHEVSRGETLSQIAGAYGVNVDKIAEYNNLRNRHRVIAGEKIRIPVSEAAGAVYAQQPKTIPVNEFSWPVTGWISSSFGMRDGRMHEGLDIGAGMGTPIRAPQDGRVAVAGHRGSYGFTVVLNHGDGVNTLYAHCSDLTVQAGEWVEEGQIIGRVGNTGKSEGPHLHMEVHVDGVPFDPLLCLKRNYA